MITTARAPAAAAIAAATGILFMLQSSPPRGRAQSAPSTCVVMQERGGSAPWRSHPELCSTRLSPASTFKIPHALVALDTGVVLPDTLEKWDGVKHAANPDWDRDHTVLTAMRPSVLWFFKRIAPRVGAARMRTWLERVDYGNARTDGDVTRYWVNGTLLVSPEEQVRFLNRFYASTLPVGAEPQRLVRDALEQPPASVQNATGVHRLDGAWPPGTAWNVKTGRTGDAGRSVSWLVGQITVSGRAHVFAAAVWRNDPTVEPLDAARLAVRTFIERGLLKRSG
jgi:beta-lactamase class D